MPLPPLERLLFKPDQMIFAINPPKGAPPFQNAARKIDLADAAVLYAIKESQLSRYSAQVQNLPPEALLWICFPKPGKLETDLGRDKLFLWMKGLGFEALRIISVDETWSAFSFKR